MIEPTVFLRETIFVSGEIRHAIFDVEEYWREQDPQGCADQGERDKERDEIGENSFHVIRVSIRKFPDG